MEKPRIGVFICHCGNNIGGVVDVPKVAEFAKGIPDVAYSEDNLYSCSEAGLSSIKESIKRHRLNRVLVASCTPRTHEALFKRACQEAGLNKYLFEFVNIREQCSWVHMQQKEEATEKAMSLVEMGVAKSKLLEPQVEEESSIIPEALIIGGGIGGMTAALNIARQGFKVHLVERKGTLGGTLGGIHTLFPTNQGADEILSPLKEEIENNDNITLYLSSRVKDVTGYIGAFHVTVDSSSRDIEFDAGTLIVATGAEEFKPHGLYGYGQLPDVITELELEEKLTQGLDSIKGAVFINCVGARVPERSYCSRFCCLTSIKNASILKAQNPRASVFVLHRDLMTYGVDFECYYREAQKAGVRFIRYGLENPPRVLGNKRVEHVSVYHELSGKEIELPCDLVILTTPLVPNKDNEEISKMLKIPLSEQGFFLEAHLKLRPVEFSTDGIYISGSARWPSDVRETIFQAYAAASKAVILMKSGTIFSEAITSFVDEDRCAGCGACVAVCPYHAIGLVEKDGRLISRVNSVQCKGCGSCVAACPNGAAQQSCYTDQQLLEMVGVLSR